MVLIASSLDCAVCNIMRKKGTSIASGKNKTDFCVGTQETLGHYILFLQQDMKFVVMAGILGKANGLSIYGAATHLYFGKYPHKIDPYYREEHFG